MIHVRLTTESISWSLLRQTPGRSGRWGDCVFHYNEPVAECDAWVVYGDCFRQVQTTRCPPDNTIFVTPEPASIQRYPERYLAQFGTVLASQPDISHRHLIRGQPGLPWHIGIHRPPGGPDECVYDYDDFKRNPPPRKTKLISVISSDKAFSEGHRRRLAFVQRLREHFGDGIDVFGRGLRPIADKWDAIAPYRFHVSLENSSDQDYWSEKLADTFLGGAYPLYNGCPNIGDYFPAASLSVIDLARPDEAVAIIDRAVAGDADRKSAAELAEARRLVLDEYNLFPLIAGLVAKLKTGPRKVVRLYPGERFDHPLRRIARPAVRLLRRTWRRFGARAG
jgi:Glycosyltransferase family 10 (fucosyltransferase) C-term